MSNYNPPEGSRVALRFDKPGFTPPPGNQVNLIFSDPDWCPDYVPPAGDQVGFEFGGPPYIPPAGDQVKFEFACPESGPVECYDWQDQPGTNVVIANFEDWQDQPGTNVVITYVCETDEGEPLGYLISYDGAHVSFDISATHWLALPAFAGETFAADIDIHPITDLDPLVFGAGEDVSGTLATTMVVPVEISDGQSVIVALETYPSIPLSLSAHTGESATTDLTRYPNLQPTASAGESVVIDIELEPYDGFVFDPIGTGESVTGDVAVSPGFRITIATGESASVEIASTVSLEFAGAAGETFAADIEANTPWSPTFVAWTGEWTTATLSADMTLAAVAVTGESARFEFQPSERPEFVPTAFTGESGSLFISVPAALGISVAYAGESATVALDEAAFYRVATGETVVADLATDTTLNPLGYAGEAAHLTLVVKKPEPFGNFRFFAGEDVFVIAGVPRAITLYPNPINAAPRFVCEFDAQTSFDLDVKTCCPEIYDSHLHIELDDMPGIGIRYDGDRTIFRADLSIAPRLSMTFVDGEAFWTRDPNLLGDVAMATGEAVRAKPNGTDQLGINLCFGNFIPDPDYINVELVSVYGDCEGIHAQTGEVMGCEVSASTGRGAHNHTGEHLRAEVWTDPAIRIHAYTGEVTKVDSFPDIRAYDGQSGALQFEIIPWNAYTGESVTFDLKVVYDVEFLEQGCLNNDYVPSTETGDPDWENYRPVPVELDFFVRSIKARCF